MIYNKFIYPRTISIYRPNNEMSATGGAAPGLATQPGSTGTTWGSSPVIASVGPGETLVQANIQCSIQGRLGKASGPTALPADAPGPSRWTILIPLKACAKGTISNRDVVIDDEGLRYMVSSPYWNSLGFKIEVVFLEL